ncbi:MAG: InlB B-repeat-containing protein [Thermoplasmata archaeon]
MSGGSLMTLLAVPDQNYHFIGWSGSGIGARNASTATLKITVNGEVMEAAQFAENPPSAPATYTLSVVESGLPAQSGWNVSIDGTVGTIGTSSTLTIGGLNGTYTLVVPIVTMSLGERWVPVGTGSYPISVNPTTGNTSYTVNFTEQFLVTMAASGHGNATPSSSEWVNAGASVQLQGLPGAGWVLSNWTGNGSGSYTGSKATTTISVSGPVSEVATFIPVAAKSTTNKSPTSSTAGLPLALGLLVVLLIVGLLVGMLLARRRRPPMAQPAEAWEASPAETVGASGQGQEGSVDSDSGGGQESGSSP